MAETRTRKLSKSQRKALGYLRGHDSASELAIAEHAFNAPRSNCTDRPMLLGVPSAMRSLERKGYARQVPGRGWVRRWKITREGKAVLDA